MVVVTQGIPPSFDPPAFVAGSAAINGITGANSLTMAAYAGASVAGQYAIVAATAEWTGAAGTISCTYGGTPMTVLGSIATASNPYGNIVYLFGLPNVPVGSVSIVSTAANGGGVYNIVQGVGLFKNVVSVGPATTSLASPPAVTISSNVSGMAVGALMSEYTSLGGFNQTTIANGGVAFGGNYHLRLAFGYAATPNSDSVTFSGGVAGYNPGGVAVVLSG